MFAFENRGVTEGAVALRPVGGNIGPVPAMREGDFQGGDRVAVFLGPEKGEAFQFEMRGGFAALCLWGGKRGACPTI